MYSAKIMNEITVPSDDHISYQYKVYYNSGLDLKFSCIFRHAKNHQFEFVISTRFGVKNKAVKVNQFDSLTNDQSTCALLSLLLLLFRNKMKRVSKAIFANRLY